MIIGLGCDVVNIDRIAKQLQQSGERFKNKYFTENEIKAAQKYTDEYKIVTHFAKRFAAKEAFAKAVGTGFGKSVSFIDVSVESDKSGKPFLVLNQKAQNLLLEITGGVLSVCHLSLSDDQPYAVAVVIIEAL